MFPGDANEHSPGEIAPREHGSLSCHPRLRHSGATRQRRARNP